MELKHFVAQTLSQIVEGIEEARKVRPSARFCQARNAENLAADQDCGAGLAVFFDIAAYIDKEEGEPEKSIIKVIAPDAAAAGSYAAATALTRISFTVPVSCPESKSQSETARGKRNAAVIPDLNISL